MLKKIIRKIRLAKIMAKFSPLSFQKERVLLAFLSAQIHSRKTS